MFWICFYLFCFIILPLLILLLLLVTLTLWLLLFTLTLWLLLDCPFFFLLFFFNDDFGLLLFLFTDNDVYTAFIEFWCVFKCDDFDTLCVNIWLCIFILLLCDWLWFIIDEADLLWWIGFINDLFDDDVIGCFFINLYWTSYDFGLYFCI